MGTCDAIPGGWCDNIECILGECQCRRGNFSAEPLSDGVTRATGVPLTDSAGSLTTVQTYIPPLGRDEE